MVLRKGRDQNFELDELVFCGRILWLLIDFWLWGGCRFNIRYAVLSGISGKSHIVYYVIEGFV